MFANSLYSAGNSTIVLEAQASPVRAVLLAPRAFGDTLRFVRHPRTDLAKLSLSAKQAQKSFRAEWNLQPLCAIWGVNPDLGSISFNDRRGQQLHSLRKL